MIGERQVMTMETNILIGLVCSVAGAVLSYLGFLRNKSKDDKKDGQQDGVMLTELGYIKSSVDTIDKKIDKQEERNLELIDRLSSVESSAKQAHRRIDHLEGRVDLHE